MLYLKFNLYNKIQRNYRSAHGNCLARNYRATKFEVSSSTQMPSSIAHACIFVGTRSLHELVSTRRTSKEEVLHLLSSLFDGYLRRSFQILFLRLPKPSWRYSFRIVKRVCQAESRLQSHFPANVQA